jgi:hypothetical protein
MLNRHQSGDEKVYKAITLTVFWEQLGYQPEMKVMGLDTPSAMTLEFVLHSVKLSSSLSIVVPGTIPLYHVAEQPHHKAFSPCHSDPF